MRSPYDRNEDGVIDRADVPDDSYPPSGKILDDIYFDPVIINLGPEIDMMYFAPEEQETTTAESVGMVYWWMR